MGLPRSAFAQYLAAAMRYFVSLDPRRDSQPDAPPPTVVDVTENPGGGLSVTVNGRTVDVDAVAVGAGSGDASGAFSVRVDGKMVDLTVEGKPPELSVITRHARRDVRVESDRQRVANAAKRAGGGGPDKVVKSPMPGRVVKILVAEGDDVAAGQPLVVVEAMKMENEVRAKQSAKIAKVHVAAGATVEGNALLITFA